MALIGSLVGYRRPNQPVHVLHRLDLRLDDTHPNFTIPPEALSLSHQQFITQ